MIDELRSDPSRLLNCLFEDSPVHAGRSAGDTARLRAEALLALAAMGLPDAALPFVVEELESGNEPVLVAAAAKAVRVGRPPDSTLTRPLLQALWNMAGRDDAVLFGRLGPAWSATGATTPLLEVIAALRHLGPPAEARAEIERFLRADEALLSHAVRTALEEAVEGTAHCCGGGIPALPAVYDGRQPTLSAMPRAVEVEDQNGKRLILADFFQRAPTVVAFFYTRCGNPRKCSLTITSLAALCRELGDRLGRVQVTAITYDPGYDIPARLLRYGRDRGLPFGPAVRMFRAVAEHDLLRQHFALRVGYTSSVVNRHGIELFLVEGGRVIETWTRRRWIPAEVAARIS